MDVRIDACMHVHSYVCVGMYGLQRPLDWFIKAFFPTLKMNIY